MEDFTNARKLKNLYIIEIYFIIGSQKFPKSMIAQNLFYYMDIIFEILEQSWNM